MFDSLSDKLGAIFDGLQKRGALKEADVTAALREVRVALLEADVALPVVKDLMGRVKARAVGAEVLRSVTPGQQVIKIVHDELKETLGSDGQGLNIHRAPPVPILMVGLQGSGKTTTSAKIAKRLTERDKQKVLMASLDTRRPAAMEQLKTLGEQNQIATLPIVEGQTAADIAKRALQAAKLQGFDVVILDTAGRMAIDEDLMAEVEQVRRIADPAETLLVADSLTGQDAVTTAKTFDERVGITGVVLTRMDGDGRGGAALSMRAVTGKPIKLVGVGEKADALEDFHPERIAGRILGMGDIVSLVEKAQETFEQEKAERLARKMQKGRFDLDDLSTQLQQMRKMGGMKSLMGMMPGMGKLQKQMDEAGFDDRMIRRQEAIISSMTPQERRAPDLMNASRKRRVAAGCGLTVQEVNRLLKMHKQMSGMMKRMGKASKRGGGMPNMAALMGMGGAAPGMGAKLPPGMGLGPGAMGPGGPGMPGLPGDGDGDGLPPLPPTGGAGSGRKPKRRKK
ncbi:signal recognition particle subunit FFH/SRP54 (srp54) [Rhodothalassium salexigens DSM 2132]|uniref:Signal recognition particle protein n=1 Tax=Rhodothalassium salexigens DSM 2132 TaxID=1188247 RepID=A0A4R2PKN0_RHOSA|nr:signal recognition particle protein [Rhodothalassium salexigens]MBB4211222.1 signal recognition particle subunit SRP54 [Rhodothalassium salexigens DSM 2132]MBK1637561.1 signal recognition particle protein [Rhodothalassium salexigens DSM 2132]TCP36123.1 signal recognition particle subunit FFH/SRP54 (srp54) [Rhodothalassium salexigens DSM 2132]